MDLQDGLQVGDGIVAQNGILLCRRMVFGSPPNPDRRTRTGATAPQVANLRHCRLPVCATTKCSPSCGFLSNAGFALQRTMPNTSWSSRKSNPDGSFSPTTRRGNRPRVRHCMLARGQQCDEPHRLTSILTSMLCTGAVRIATAATIRAAVFTNGWTSSSTSTVAGRSSPSWAATCQRLRRS